MNEIFFVIALALIASAVFIGMGRRGPGIAAGLVFFFTIFLLFGWAATLWIEPVGPPFLGIYWTAPFTATILLALILLSIIPPRQPRGLIEEELRQQSETPGETRTRHAVEIGVGAFFWLAVIGLVAVILMRSFS
ncbi:hypothetical protein [Haloferula sp. A504]|uniref:hypothetical protein n=1 Tax=Haloferula sp. A504 TaxID=3373601 RepID=UPI0031BC6A23|nr:hypothetical protein [Verrucomicrobiaceae bacterium E54]